MTNKNKSIILTQRRLNIYMDDIINYAIVHHTLITRIELPYTDVRLFECIDPQYGLYFIEMTDYRFSDLSNQIITIDSKQVSRLSDNRDYYYLIHDKGKRRSIPNFVDAKSLVLHCKVLLSYERQP